jgi:cell division septum initiation protein DivIVA
MKPLLRSSLVCLLMSSMLLAQSAAPSQGTAAKSKAKTGTRRTTAKAAAGPTTEDQLRELRDMLSQQQQQIRQLQSQLAARDQQVQQAQQSASEASAKASEAASRATEAANSIGDTKTQVASLSDTVGAVKMNSQNLTETIQSEQKRVTEAVESPTAIHFKGATISFTGSFVAGETVWRDRGLASDINTQLSAGPFDGAPNANLSEFNASGRQSRLAILVEGKLSPQWTGRGYYEMDWLGAGVTSNSNQSNSYLNRQRQIFAQAESASGWTFTGGQTWSLVTETRSGLQNRTEVLPQTIDAQYTAGFSWERQFGFRVTKNVNKKVFLGAAIEEAQTLNLGGGASGTFTYQQAGNTGGLLNNGGFTAQQNYSYNYLPDFVFKAAFEPGYGHYEVFGLVRGFRNRVFPNATAANVGTAASGVGAFNYTAIGGGIGGNARFAIVPKKLDLGFHILAGDGVDRYGDSTLADVTTRLDGTLAPIRGGSALVGLELHATPKLEVYAYYGGDYAERQLYNAAGSAGYGRFTAATTGCTIETIAATGNNTPVSTTTNPASCSPDTRDIQELSTGFWYDFYRGNKGRLRQGFQYSYLNKQTWRGTGGSPTANTNMVFTSFRYYIP